MKSLFYSLLLISILFCCQQKDVKTEKKQEQTEIAIDPSLYKKLVTDNPTIDSATFEMLDGVFPGSGQSAAYAGSEVIFYPVKDANVKPELWKFAYANISEDALIINIKNVSRLSETFGGSGIAFVVVDNKSTAQYYKSSDMIMGDHNGTTTWKSSKNHLTLNTDHFAVGDTIAGKLLFETELNMYASGYFRAVIDNGNR